MSVLRAATTEDMKDLASWFRSTKEARQWGGPGFEFPCDTDSFTRQCRLSELSSWVLDADESGREMIGFGQFYQRLERCHLARLAIAPQLRKRGHGKSLVRMLLTTGMKQLQTTEASLFVYDDNEPACRLYAQLGFRRQQWPRGEPPQPGISLMTYVSAIEVGILRCATVADLGRLSALCLRSKAYWGYDEAFMEACLRELTLTAQDLVDTAVVALEDNAGELLGMAQVSTEGENAWTEKLFVEPDHLGRGIGARLYRWCVETAKGRGASVLITESDPNALSFYEKMGAQRSGTAPSSSVPGRMLPRLVHSLG